MRDNGTYPRGLTPPWPPGARPSRTPAKTAFKAPPRGGPVSDTRASLVPIRQVPGLGVWVPGTRARRQPLSGFTISRKSFRSMTTKGGLLSGLRMRRPPSGTQASRATPLPSLHPHRHPPLPGKLHLQVKGPPRQAPGTASLALREERGRVGARIPRFSKRGSARPRSPWVFALECKT